jgi:hypothetical protein
METVEFKTIKEKLDEGERVILTKEEIAARIENGPEDALVVKHLSLYQKMRQLQEIGTLKLKKGRFDGGRRFLYKGRKLRFVIKFKGKSSWQSQTGDFPHFSEAHDLAIDPKTKMIVVSAVSTM